MKLSLLVFCSLFFCISYGADQSSDAAKKKPKHLWDTFDGTRQWNKWFVTSGDISTWYEWWHGFCVKRSSQYAEAIIDGKKENTIPLSVTDTFKGHEIFKQDPGHAHWINFCEKKTENLLHTQTDKLTLYQLEEFFDCCGTHIRSYAKQRDPQIYQHMIELVDNTENAIIAVKALESVIKSKNGQI
jgi:hypothetical protein